MVKLLKCVLTFIGRAVSHNPEVQAFFARHPRLVRFLRHRLSPDKRFGSYVTIGVLLALMCLLLFLGAVEDLLSQDPLIQSAP